MPQVHPALDGAGLIPSALLAGGPRLLPTPALAALAGRLAAARQVWRPVVRHDPAERWYVRLLLTEAVEVWLIGWAPGQRTAVHDHGGALGALAVAEGRLREEVYDAAWRPAGRRVHRAGASVTFPAEHVHRVGAAGGRVATSVHAYSPPALPLRYAPAAAPLTAGAL